MSAAMDLQKISLSIALFLSTLLISGDGWERTPQSVFIDSGQVLGGSAASTAVALGDIDGDGDLDAVMAISDGPSKVYINQGGDQGGTEGDFLDSGQNLTDDLAVDVALDDLDGDGDLDAYIVLDKAGSSNEVWLNQGISTGVFTKTDQTFGEGRNTSSVALGDLDGVGGPDAFVSHFWGVPSKVWFNDGSGAFGDSGQMLDDDSADVALGDLDGDGDLDAFSANGSTNRVWVNQGGDQGGEPGVFVDSGQMLTSSLSLSISLGDVDGDGDLDAYVGNSQADRLWVNQGGSQGGAEGVFQDSGQSLSNSFVQTRDVSLGDLDGDGDLDAFLAKGGNEVWINQGGTQGGTEGVLQDSGQNLGDSASEGLALGDVDGDGDLDAFVANWGQPDKVWLNSEAGGGNEQPGLFSASKQDLGNGTNEAVVLGDLDMDGDLDAVVGGSDFAKTSEVWINDAEGVFSLNQEFGSGGEGVALGDLDSDGDLDAFFVTKYLFNIWFNGEGGDPLGMFSLGQQEFGEQRDWQDVALGDLDMDGDLDAFLVGSNFGENTMEIWLNGEEGNAEGVFILGQLIDVNFNDQVALGDLDGDDDLDAFVVGESIIVLLNGEGNDPPGYFSEGQSLEFRGKAVALGDLDGDGDLDAFVAGSGANTFFINGFLGDEGTFTASGELLGDANSTDVALGDLDGDGDLDAFTTTGSEEVRSQSNEIWDNGGDNLGAQCLGSEDSYGVGLGDLDGDGDLDAFIANHGPNKVWFNGQGAFCSCIVNWLYEEIFVPRSANNSRTTSVKLVSLQSLGAELQTYLDLRDDLLSQSSLGLRYARLYDDHNAEIFALLFNDAALRDEGLAALQLWQPDLQALLDGEGDSVTIDAMQVQVVDDFLTNLSAAASPDLQQVIAEERANLPPLSTFAGLTLEEARGIVLPHETYLPSLLRE